MHTYLKRDEDVYEVGQWLRHPEGYDRFQALFAVPSLKQAFHAVNSLNGGRQINIDNLHIVERD
jgi:hypothetical protein